MKTFKKYLFESLNKQDMAKLKPLKNYLILVLTS